MKEGRKYRSVYLPEELERIYDNFDFIVSTGPLSRNELTDPKSANPIMAPNTFAKFTRRLPDYSPRETVLKALIQYFNANFSPEINLYTLKKVDMAAQHYTRNKSSQKDIEWYTGLLYGYFFSTTHTQEGALRIAILNLYEWDNHFCVQAVMGFQTANDVQLFLDTCPEQSDKMSALSFRELIEQKPKQLYHAVQQYKKNISPYKRRIPYYRGEIKFFDYALNMSMELDNSSYQRSIILPRNNPSTQLKYEGGIGAMLSMRDGHNPTRVQAIGLSRHLLIEGDALQVQLLELSGESNRVHSVEGNNGKWYEYVINSRNWK